MANKNEKYTENISGPYYVDQDCISCDTCGNLAGDHFKLTDNNDHAFVFLQPVSECERQACDEAMENCPVKAIGNDG